MRFSYHPDTSALYIHLSEKPSVDVVEMRPGFVFDYGADGKLVGMVADLSLPAAQEVTASPSTPTPVGSRANGYS